MVHVGTHPPVRVGPGRLLAVTADNRSLGWLTDASVLGLARLDDPGRWAELADVVLVPDEDGVISRCFWPQELKALLVGAGFSGRLDPVAFGLRLSLLQACGCPL